MRYQHHSCKICGKMLASAMDRADGLCSHYSIGMKEKQSCFISFLHYLIQMEYPTDKYSVPKMDEMNYYVMSVSIKYFTRNFEVKHLDFTISDVQVLFDQFLEQHRR